MMYIKTPLLMFFACLIGVYPCCYAKITFLHIPKTAGITVHSSLESQFDVREIYPLRKQDEMEKFIGKFPLNDYELVSGHFPYWLLKANDPNFDSTFLFTVLRDPVERVISEYYFDKRSDPTLSSPLQIKPNKICYFLCSNPHLTGEQLLEDCINNLQKLDAVIFLDTLDSDLQSLFNQLGLRNADIEVPLTNACHTRKEVIDQELLNKIREANALDIQLYEYAKTYLRKKTHVYLQAYKSWDQLFQMKTSFHYSFDMPMFGKNWYYRESPPNHPTYRWAQDKEASIFFPLVPNHDYLLVFYAHTLNPDTSLFVKIGNKAFEASRKNPEAFARYEVIIPKETINHDLTEIFFSGSYSEVFNIYYPGTLDTRKLSFAITSIEITPINLYK